MLKKGKKIIISIALLIILCVAVVKFETKNQSDFEMVCFDVGKGDAFLFTSGEGNVLIDTGYSESGKEIVSYLEEHHIEDIDYLIITHFDKDHVGGAASIIEEMNVKNVLQPVYEKESKHTKEYEEALVDRNIESQKVTQGYDFEIGQVTYHIDPPHQDVYDKKQSNNSSLIVSIVYDQTNFLFTGDAEDERLEEYMSIDDSTYTFLKVPYHGNYQDILPAFFDQVAPSYAVITSSEDEPEDPETVQELDNLGCQVYFTKDGNLYFECDGKTVKKLSE